MLQFDHIVFFLPTLKNYEYYVSLSESSHKLSIDSFPSQPDFPSILITAFKLNCIKYIEDQGFKILVLTGGWKSGALNFTIISTIQEATNNAEAALILKSFASSTKYDKFIDLIGRQKAPGVIALCFSTKNINQFKANSDEYDCKDHYFPHLKNEDLLTIWPKCKYLNTHAAIIIKNKTFDTNEISNICIPAVFDHWVINRHESDNFIEVLENSLNLYEQVNFRSGVIAAGKSQIISVVMANKLDSKSVNDESIIKKLGIPILIDNVMIQDKESLMKEFYDIGNRLFVKSEDEFSHTSEKIFVPVNTPLSEYGHVSNFVNQRGPGVQHIALRLSDLCAMVEYQNYLHINSNCGLQLMSIPLTYYGYIPKTGFFTYPVMKDIKQSLTNCNLLSDGSISIDTNIESIVSCIEHLKDSIVKTYKLDSNLGEEHEQLIKVIKSDAFPYSNSSDEQNYILNIIAFSLLWYRVSRIRSLVGHIYKEEYLIRLAKNRILVDIQNGNILLQIFSLPYLKNNFSDGPFFELIQRDCSGVELPGCGGMLIYVKRMNIMLLGFGSRNFLMLFMAIEVQKAQMSLSTYMTELEKLKNTENLTESDIEKDLLTKIQQCNYLLDSFEAQTKLSLIVLDFQANTTELLHNYRVKVNPSDSETKYLDIVEKIPENLNLLEKTVDLELCKARWLKYYNKFLPQVKNKNISNITESISSWILAAKQFRERVKDYPEHIKHIYNIKPILEFDLYSDIYQNSPESIITILKEHETILSNLLLEISTYFTKVSSDIRIFH